MYRKTYDEVTQRMYKDKEKANMSTQEVTGNKFSTKDEHGGMDKIKRYGWKVQDQPGELMLLDKNELRIPPYQRELNHKKALEIVSAWSWVALGAIVVGQRDDEYWVIDGQHRVAAALRRSDVTTLPCVVFRTNDTKEEARGFLSIQTCRKPIAALDKQKAMVTAGDEIAGFVDKTLASLGIEAKKRAYAGQIKCLGWCLRRAAEDKTAFRAVLSLVKTISDKDDMSLQEKLLEGIWYLNQKCGDGLNDPRLVTRIREKGARKLLDAAIRASAYHTRGGSQVWGMGMLEEINKGLRNRFEVNAPEPKE